jgi:hypothetical protein
MASPFRQQSRLIGLNLPETRLVLLGLSTWPADTRSADKLGLVGLSELSVGAPRAKAIDFASLRASLKPRPDSNQLFSQDSRRSSRTVQRKLFVLLVQLGQLLGVEDFPLWKMTVM